MENKRISMNIKYKQIYFLLLTFTFQNKELCAQT